MQKMKAARHGRTHNRANSLTTDYEHYTLIAGLILGAFFGLLIGWGL